MKFILSKCVILAAGFISSSVESIPDIPMPEIVGGEPSEPGEYPYYVYMGYPGCGGALIGPDLVLTAAHCDDFTGNQVVVGAMKKESVKFGAEARICQKWVGHPDYNPSTTDQDFALCKLDRPVYMDSVSDVTLEVNFDNEEPEPGDDLMVMGLGTLSSGGNEPNKVHNVSVPAISNEDCNDGSSYSGEITENMICAGFFEGGKDSCQGDSGGPLVKRQIKDGKRVDLHVGVVSWGYGCAWERFPGVYARTSKAETWIKSVACDEFDSIAPFCDNEPVECAGDTLVLNITTNDKPGQTTWELSGGNGIVNQVYLYQVPDHENMHVMCLEEDQCYTLDIDGKGSYSLSRNDDVIVSDETLNGRRTHSFCPTFPEECESSESGYQMELDTDYWGTESTVNLFLLKDSFDEVEESVYARSSFASTANITLPGDGEYVCLEDACYWAVLRDSYGDGIFDGGLKGYVNDELKYTLDGDFTYVTSDVFCTGDICKDDNSVALPKDKNCVEYVSGSKKQKKKRCKKKVSGVKVFNHCPETCGRIGLGPCSWMKKLAKDLEGSYDFRTNEQ